MKNPARFFLLSLTLVSLSLLVLAYSSPTETLAQSSEYVFYGEDREEQRLGQTVLTDVDGFLEKLTYEGASCVERYNNLSSQAATVQDQADEFLAGVYCPAERLQARRFYLSFDTTTIPDDETVVTATLYLTKAETAVSEANTRFEVLGTIWGDPLRLRPSEWASGTNSLGYFDPPPGDPAGTTYTVSLNPSAINKSGRTQFEIRLYDEAGQTSFYGSSPEIVLQQSRQRIFSSGDGLPQEDQPRLAVNTQPTVGGKYLWNGWNKIAWTADSLTIASALSDVDTQCGTGTAPAGSRRKLGFWESFRQGYGGVNFLLASGKNYYILASRDCAWDKL